MPSSFSVRYPFEALRTAIDGCADTLFGTAEILVDRTTWRIGQIDIDTLPQSPSLKVKPESEVHLALCVALDAQFGEKIDDLVADAIERRGGYMALYGERMPTSAALRGLPAFRGSKLCFGPRADRAMSRTFAL